MLDAVSRNSFAHRTAARADRLVEVVRAVGQLAEGVLLGLGPGGVGPALEGFQTLVFDQLALAVRAGVDRNTLDFDATEGDSALRASWHG